MNKKKICGILLCISGFLGFLLGTGVADRPVYAADSASGVISQHLSTFSSVVNEDNDYLVNVNETVEKQGVKFTIKSIIATKNKLEVNAVIESSTPFSKNIFDNEIVQMTIKNCDYESHGHYSEMINSNTMRYKFNFYSKNGFDKNIALRFDAAIPAMDINAWVLANVDISKGFDKVVEKDVEFSFGNYDFYKFESDVMETSLYYRDNELDYDTDSAYENSYVYSQSMLLLKYNEKLYVLEDGYSYMNDEENTFIGQYSTPVLKYGEILNDSEISIIPINCKIRRSEMEEIFDNYDYPDEHETENDEINKIRYNKNFIFSDNTRGVISKVERKEDKIKVYCTSDSEKKSMMMAVGLAGWYDYDVDEHYNGIINDYDVNKIIYKNPEDENGYIVEYNNVVENIPFSIESNDILLGLVDKFEIGSEIKIK